MSDSVCLVRVKSGGKLLDGSAKVLIFSVIFSSSLMSIVIVKERGDVKIVEFAGGKRRKKVFEKIVKVGGVCLE